MDLGNPFEVAVYYFLIREINGLGHQDEFPMVSTLGCDYTLDRTYGES